MFYVFCLENVCGVYLKHFQTDYVNPALVKSNPMTLLKLYIFKVTNDLPNAKPHRYSLC